ncbi:hypothetical protein MTO96_033400 [Rhipicephalus appendiculatus]
MTFVAPNVPAQAKNIVKKEALVAALLALLLAFPTHNSRGAESETSAVCPKCRLLYARIGSLPRMAATASRVTKFDYWPPRGVLTNTADRMREHQHAKGFGEL